MSPAPAPSAASGTSLGALRGARTLCLSIALLLAACQTDTPHQPHANQHGSRLPVQAAIPVLNAADALPGHLHAAPAAPALSPDSQTQTVATLDPADPADPAPPDNNPDLTPATSITPRTAPHNIRLSQPPLDNPDAADLLDDWGHRSFGRILAHRPLADPPADGDAERLSAILDAARGPDGSPPVPNLHDDDKIVVFGSRRGITLGRWIAGAADTLSMSFDLSHAGPATEQREGFLPLLKRAGRVWTGRIHDTWEPWELVPGHVKLHLSTQDGPETPIAVGPDGEISTGIEVHVASLDLPGSTAGLGGPINRWPTDRWEPHFGTLTLDTHHLYRAEDHQLLSTLVHELGHVLGSWLGVTYTQPYAPYTDEQTGHWTGPNVVALHGGPAPFQDQDNPFDSHAGQRDANATHYDLAHSGICASAMAYCKHGTSAPAILPAPIDFAFLADLGLSVRPATDRPETYGLAGWMHHSGFAFSVSRDLRMDVAYPTRNGGRGFHATPRLGVSDLLHAEAIAFGRRSTGDLLTTYPPDEHFGNARYAGTLIGAAIHRPALPPVTGDAALSLSLDSLEGDADFTSLTVHSAGEPEPFAGGALHYPIAFEDNVIASTGTDATLSAAFFGPAHEEVAGTLHDAEAGLMASFGATHDARPASERILAEADHLTGLTVTRDPEDPSSDLRTQHRCTDATSCGTRQTAAGQWSDWTPETRKQAVGSTTADQDFAASRPVQDLDFLRIARIPAPQDADQPDSALDAAYLGALTHGAFGTGVDPTSTAWTGAYGVVSGSVPETPAQWTGIMLGYSHGPGDYRTPFVRGQATLDLDLADMDLALTVSDVATVDSLHTLPDFHFDDIELAPDGTFHSDGKGVLAGALLGPNREDAAGSFHHDAAEITGSFGAHAVPDTVNLVETGKIARLGTVTDDLGTRDYHSFHDWGIWAEQFGRQLFAALVRQATTVEGDATRYYQPRTAVSGTPSGTNPVSGGAVWNGEARAFHDWPWFAATAAARIEADFAATTVDVDITDFDTAHPDMSWEDMPLSEGKFTDAAFRPTIEGSFYGAVHQGVAGTFRSDQLRGVFGAVRNDTVNLIETGKIELLGTVTDDLGTRDYHSFHDWGIWAEDSGHRLFEALIQHSTTVEGDTTRYGEPHTAVSGTPSGTDPVSGGAVWNGEARAFHDQPWVAATAAARIEVDFAATTVDVDITDFDTAHPDMSWEDMPLSAGTFTDAASEPTIEGSFYGADHQGVAGTFRSDQLQGVFGAVR